VHLDNVVSQAAPYLVAVAHHFGKIVSRIQINAIVVSFGDNVVVARTGLDIVPGSWVHMIVFLAFACIRIRLAERMWILEHDDVVAASCLDFYVITSCIQAVRVIREKELDVGELRIQRVADALSPT